MKGFLDFIEIRTKTVSVLSFFLGTAYAAYRYGPGRLDPLLGVVLFVAVLLFDMTTTAVNNHVEYRHRLREVARGETPHASIRDYRMGTGAQLAAILVMFAAATAAGLWVASRTDIVVLLAGVLCFAVGVLYSAGPLPIARTPFTISTIAGMSRSLGLRQAAPMQNRVLPLSLACAADCNTCCTSISLVATTPESALTDCEQ